MARGLIESYETESKTELEVVMVPTDAGAAMIKRIPQRHIGNESDLDGALLLLASNASQFMTGSVLAVYGGHRVSSL